MCHDVYFPLKFQAAFGLECLLKSLPSSDVGLASDCNILYELASVIDGVGTSIAVLAKRRKTKRI